MIAVDTNQLAPGESAVLYTWLAAAEDHEGVHLLDFVVRQRMAEYFVTRTINYWRAWVRREEIRFHDLPEAVKDLYNRNLLVLRTNVDNRGGIIAANDSDLSELVYGQETYSYVWPRDGAYIANALDGAGYSHLARGFYNFFQDLIYCEPGQDSNIAGHQKTAYMLHKYSTDGSIASNWMPYIGEDGTVTPPIQENETAVIPYVLWQHYLRHRDVETITPLYRPLIVDAAAFMSEFRDPHTKLPAPSFDLWEERRAIYSYTVATEWAGLSAAANFAELFGEFDDAERFRRAATEIKEACEIYLYDDKEGRFLKSISVHPDGNIVPDNTIDASLYGLWYFGLFEPNDPRIERTMKGIVDRLRCRTDIGGLARYEGDEYHWDCALDQKRDKIPGNPWIISTLWLAQYSIAKAESLEGLKLAIPMIEWACDRALPSGVLAEQIHPLTGEPLSVSPLTWSHATVVTTVLDYVDKYEQLQGRAQCG